MPAAPTPPACPCGQPATLAGLCRPCYRSKARSRARFAGHREEILARDAGACRSCGAGKSRLHVHHRRPGIHDPQWLITVCAACHARLHRLRTVRFGLPEVLVDLWIEQHPGRPQQLPLVFAEAA